MSLWSNTDANTSAPKYAVAGGLGVSANGFVTYGNTTTDAFVTGIALGTFGVSPDETTGVGNVATFTVQDAGTGAFGLPTVTVTGANTTQATATINVKVVSATINASGTGYAVGNTVFVNAGANTTRAVLTITSVNGSGNVTGLSITTAGKYSTVISAATNSTTFLSNTASGTGLTANIRFGLESVTVNAAGQDYNQSTVGATVSGNGISSAAVTVNLDGNDASNKGAHAGWVLRKVGTGGRAGRVQVETLVAMGSMTGDGADDTQFGE
jgi:hypothetical protein